MSKLKALSKFVRLRTERYNSWDLFRVEETAFERGARLLELFWIAGDGAVSNDESGERFDGSLHDTGDGYSIDLGSQSIELDYSEAHSLRLLLHLVDEEKWRVEKFVASHDEGVA